MSTNENKQLMQRWWDALNQGNALEIIEEVYAADYVMHDPTLPGPVQGLEGVHEFISSVVTGFPNARYTIEEMIAEGDKVLQRLTVRGIHEGEFQGIPATGQPVTIWLMVVSRVANNKVVEEWQMVDALSLMQQLGVIPVPEQE